MSSPALARSSQRYGDVVAALLLAAIAVWATGVEPRTIALIGVAAVSTALALHDLRERRLPNRLVLTGFAAAAIAGLGQWAVIGEPPTLAILASASYFVFLLALALAGGMGLGDVKLAAALGFAAGLVGMPAAVLSPVFAFTAGGVAAIVALARHTKTIPFGPFMLAGFWAAVVLSRVLPEGAPG